MHNSERPPLPNLDDRITSFLLACQQQHASPAEKSRSFQEAIDALNACNSAHQSHESRFWKGVLFYGFHTTLQLPSFDAVLRQHYHEHRPLPAEVTRKVKSIQKLQSLWGADCCVQLGAWWPTDAGNNLLELLSKIARSTTLDVFMERIEPIIKARVASTSKTQQNSRCLTKADADTYIRHFHLPVMRRGHGVEVVEGDQQNVEDGPEVVTDENREREGISGSVDARGETEEETITSIVSLTRKENGAVSTLIASPTGQGKDNLDQSNSNKSPLCSPEIARSYRQSKSPHDFGYLASDSGLSDFGGSVRGDDDDLSSVQFETGILPDSPEIPRDSIMSLPSICEDLPVTVTNRRARPETADHHDETHNIQVSSQQFFHKDPSHGQEQPTVDALHPNGRGQTTSDEHHRTLPSAQKSIRHNLFTPPDSKDVSEAGDIIQVGEEGPTPATTEPESQKLTTSFQTLMDGCWLDTTALGSILMLFRLDDCKVCEPQWLLSFGDARPSVASIRDAYNGRRALALPTSLRLVVAPVIQRNHYSLVVLDNVRRTYSYYDSMRGGILPHKEMQLFLEYLKRSYLGLNSVEGGEEFAPQHEVCDKQPNSYDCGIYVLVNAIHLLLGMPVPLKIQASWWRWVFRSLWKQHIDPTVQVPPFYLYTMPIQHSDEEDNYTVAIVRNAIYSLRKDLEVKREAVVIEIQRFVESCAAQRSLAPRAQQVRIRLQEAKSNLENIRLRSSKVANLAKNLKDLTSTSEPELASIFTFDQDKLVTFQQESKDAEVTAYEVLYNAREAEYRVSADIEKAQEKFEASKSGLRESLIACSLTQKALETVCEMCSPTSLAL